MNTDHIIPSPKPPRAWWQDKMWLVYELGWNPNMLLTRMCLARVELSGPDIRYLHHIEKEEDANPILMYPTGLQDKNGTEIYGGKKHGDVVRIRMAERDEQTHYGENIPRPDGKYTEPLEAVVKEVIAPVIFRDGMFTIEHIPIEESGYWPLSVWINAWAHYETTQDMVKAFEGGWNIPVRWDDEEEGDLQYLLSEYKLKSEAELLAYLGVEVIGNSLQHPGLLKTETPPN